MKITMAWALCAALTAGSSALGQNAYSPYNWTLLTNISSGTVDSIGVDNAGNVYCSASTYPHNTTDYVVGEIWKLAPDGGLTMVASVENFANGNMAVAPGGNVYVRMVTASQNTLVLLGAGNVSDSFHPGAFGMAVDSSGVIYSTGYASNPTNSGAIAGAVYRTVGGSPSLAVAFEDNLPNMGGIAADNLGHAYAVQGWPYLRIWKVLGDSASIHAEQGGLVATDNSQRTAALSGFYRLAADSAGNVYIGGAAPFSAGNPSLVALKLKPSGEVDTLWTGPNILTPLPIAVDRLGSVYISVANEIWKGTPPAPVQPVVKLNPPQLNGGQTQVGFSQLFGSASGFALLQADHPSGPWATNAVAALTTNIPDQSYTFTLPTDAPTRFFKIQAQ